MATSARTEERVCVPVALRLLTGSSTVFRHSVDYIVARKAAIFSYGCLAAAGRGHWPVFCIGPCGNILIGTAAGGVAYLKAAAGKAA